MRAGGASICKSAPPPRPTNPSRADQRVADPSRRLIRVAAQRGRPSASRRRASTGPTAPPPRSAPPTPTAPRALPASSGGPPLPPGPPSRSAFPPPPSPPASAGMTRPGPARAPSLLSSPSESLAVFDRYPPQKTCFLDLLFSPMAVKQCERAVGTAALPPLSRRPPAAGPCSSLNSPRPLLPPPLSQLPGQHGVAAPVVGPHRLPPHRRLLRPARRLPDPVPPGPPRTHAVRRAPAFGSTADWTNRPGRAAGRPSDCPARRHPTSELVRWGGGGSLRPSRAAGWGPQNRCRPGGQREDAELQSPTAHRARVSSLPRAQNRYCPGATTSALACPAQTYSPAGSSAVTACQVRACAGVSAVCVRPRPRSRACVRACVRA